MLEENLINPNAQLAQDVPGSLAPEEGETVSYANSSEASPNETVLLAQVDKKKDYSYYSEYLKESKRKEDISPRAEEEPDTTFQDIDETIVGNVRAIPAAALDNLQGVTNTAMGLADWVAEKFDGNADYRATFADDMFPKTGSSVKGDAARGIIGFFMGFSALKYGTKGKYLFKGIEKAGKAGELANVALSSAAVDTVLENPMDPDQLTNFAELLGVGSMVPEFMAKKPNQELLNRLRNGLASGFVGLASDLALDKIGSTFFKKKGPLQPYDKLSEEGKELVDRSIEGMEVHRNSENVRAQVQAHKEGQLKAVPQEGGVDLPPKVKPDKLEVDAPTMKMFDDSAEMFSSTTARISKDYNTVVDKVLSKHKIANRHEPIPREIQLEIAKKLDINPETIARRMSVNDLMTTEIMLKAAYVQKTHFDQVMEPMHKDFWKKIEKGTDNLEDHVQYQYMTSLTKDLFAKTELSMTEVGRTLEAGKARKKILGNSRESMKRIEDQASVPMTVQRTRDVLHAERMLNKELRAKAFMAKIGKPLKDGLNSTIGFLNASLLGNPVSHVRNVVSPLVHFGGNVVERQLGWALSGGDIKFLESYHMVKGSTAAIYNSIRNSGKGIRGVVTTTRVDDVSTYGKEFLKDNMNPFSLYAKTIYGSLGKADEYLQKVFQNGEAYALAHREAANGARKGGNYADIYTSTLKNDPGIWDQAKKFGEEMTFNSELQGMAKSIQGARIENPGLKFLIPFFRTNVNILKTKLDRIPGVAALMPSTYEAIGKAVGGDKKALAMIVSRQTVGGATMVAGYHLYENGILTGTTAHNKEQRELNRMLGIEENSIKVGGKNLKIMDALPYGPILKLGADIASLASSDDPKLREASDRMSAAIGMFIGTTFNPDFLTEGMGGFFDVLNSDDPAKVQKYVAEQSNRFVPFSGTLRFTRAVMDGDKKDIKGYSASESTKMVSRVVNEFRKALMLDKMLEESNLYTTRNMFGKPVSKAPGVINTFMHPFLSTKVSEVSKSIEGELKELGLDRDPYNQESKGHFLLPRPISNKIVLEGVGSVTLDAKDYDRLQVLASGGESKVPLDKAWDKLIKSRGYQKLKKKTDDPKANSNNRQIRILMLSNITNAYHGMGRALFEAERGGTPMAKQARKEYMRENLNILRAHNVDLKEVLGE